MVFQLIFIEFKSFQSCFRSILLAMSLTFVSVGTARAPAPQAPSTAAPRPGSAAPGGLALGAAALGGLAATGEASQRDGNQMEIKWKSSRNRSFFSLY